MSNCISLRNERVVFKARELDISRLLKELRKHKECKGFDQHGKDNDDENDACYMAQWFLVEGKNVEVICGPQSMSYEKLSVLFQHGNSSHTFRDFKATVIFINRFMLQEKTHVFDVRDDDMGGDRFSREEVVFSPGEKQYVFVRDIEHQAKMLTKQLENAKAAKK